MCKFPNSVKDLLLGPVTVPVQSRNPESRGKIVLVYDEFVTISRVFARNMMITPTNVILSDKFCIIPDHNGKKS